MKIRFVLLFFWFVVLAVNIAIQFWMIISILFNVQRAIEIAIAYDRLGNAAMGQGYETISSYAGKKNGWQEVFVNWLFFVLTGEKNHCDKNREKI